MTVIDLKSLLDSSHFNLKNIKEMANEYWTDSLFANNGFSPATRFEKVCQTISRELQGPKVFVHGSVPMYGICSANLSRKSPRYRDMFACDAIQTLSHGNPRQGFKVNFGRRKRKQRLAAIACAYTIVLNRPRTFNLPLWFSGFVNSFTVASTFGLNFLRSGGSDFMFLFRLPRR